MWKRSRATLSTASGILLLQFLTIPFLGDISSAGKLFVFTFVVLFSALWHSFCQEELRVSPVVPVFMLLGAVFFVSAWLALEPGWAFVQAGVFGVFIIFLLQITHLAHRRQDFLPRLIDALLVFGLIAALLGLYEFLHFKLIGPTRSMLIPYLLPPSVSDRASGPYGQPNHLALFLVVTLLAYFYRFVHAPRVMMAARFSLLRFLPFLVVAYVYFLTGSRSGLLSLGLVLGFLAWLVASRRYLVNDPARRAEFFRLLGLIGIAFLLTRLPIMHGSSGEQLVRTLAETGISASSRYVFWTSAVLIFLDNPWLGIGLDHYKNLMNAYGPTSHDWLGFVPYEAMTSTYWAHNELLQVLCEGGLFAFVAVFALLVLLLVKMWKNFVKKKDITDPVFLYSHMLLLPFIIHSMFGWPLRAPSLLILFFACLGVLLSQYSLVQWRIPAWRRKIVQVTLLLGLCLSSLLFYQELRIGAFKYAFLREKPVDKTLPEFVLLAQNPYSAFRVLNGALKGYLREALNRDDDSLALKILPYYEQLSGLEGTRWQWYDLARLYLKLGREADAREAVHRALDLMPLDPRIGALQHYLNMLKAARATGRPLDSFWPRGEKVDFGKLELEHD